MMKMGMSCVDITPPIGIAMDGFAAREPSSLGVHDRLKATSLVIVDGENTAAVLSCDLCDMDVSLVSEVRQEISARTGIPGKHVAVACTHTHYGPAVSEYNAFYKPSSAVTAYRAALKFYLAGAVEEAAANMREVTIGVGWGTSNIGVNRRQIQADGTIILGQNPEKPIDRQVGILKIQTSDQPGSACIVNFACHPVSQTWRMRFISADYPGKAREVVETLTGAHCMFLQGACGNINPVWINYSYEPARKLGTQLGCEIVKVWEDINPVSDGSLAVASETIKIPRYNYGSKENAVKILASLEKEIEKLKKKGAAEGLINWTKLRRKRVTQALESWNTGKPLPTVEAEIQAWKLGDLGIVFVPGELFNEIGVYVKQHSPFADTFFVGYANGNVGYVPTREAYAEGGYEVNAACQVSPEAEELITKKCLELLETLHKKP